MTTTTTYTNTNANANANAPVAAVGANALVAAVDNDNCCTARATSADLCAPYITLEEARREKQEEEDNKQRRAKWGDRLESAQHHAFKRVRAAMEEETDTVKAAAMRERLASSLAMLFEPALERKVTRQKRLVESG
jgi:flagellar motor switch protein FliM